jgi:hypothetical protein
MMMYGGVFVYIHVFLELVVGEQTALHPSHFIPREIALVHTA